MTVAALPGQPEDDDGPVFSEPWQAQAFALTLNLHSQGLFSWSEWAECLGAEIRDAGDQDTGERYYHHWLAALEKLLAAKQLVGEHERMARKQAWDQAARHTKHGQPIVLPGTGSAE